MWTRDILFGLNMLSLAGFLVMGVSLALNRQHKIGAPIAFGLMAVGTLLLLLGVYLGEATTQ